MKYQQLNRSNCGSWVRLAFWLVSCDRVDGEVEVAIDGAQVRVGNTVHFEISTFLERYGWRKQSKQSGWQDTYRRDIVRGWIRIHSIPGKGDVVAHLSPSGRTLRAECKKEPLVRSASSPEYPLIREALGQLLTIQEVRENDALAVALPHSAKFAQLAQRWRQAPLISRFGIKILTVDRAGNVYGLED